MARTLSYPIYTNIPISSNSVNYTIETDGEVFYNGVLYKKDNETEIEIDISPIIKDKIPYVIADIGFIGQFTIPAIKTFTVSNGNSYQAYYNYNTDYIFDVPTGTILNAPIAASVDPRQLIGYSTLTESGIVVNQQKPYGAVGTVVTYGGIQYDVISECKDRYALYYVNLNGGIDYLLCNGKVINKWSSNRTTVRFYNDRSDRQSFERQHIYQDVTKSYTINTGWLTEDRAANINHLFMSRKIWIHDLTNDTITACIIESNSIDEQNNRYDNEIINYSFNVSESQLYIAR